VVGDAGASPTSARSIGKRFVGKVALVTGGNSGIGRATAERIAREGGKVSVACRDVVRGEDVARAIREAGGEAMVVKCDVGVPEDADRAVEATVRALGGLDVLVNAAGTGGELSAVTEVDDARWAAIMDVNVGGAFRLSRAALPSMMRAGGGAIVHVSSIAALEAVPRAAPYVASKTALVGLTRSMAHDYAYHRVRVTCVCPAYVDTPLLRRVFDAQPDPRRTRVRWTALHPLGRLGLPEDVAAAVTFLAADEAAWITGVVLPVDGGYLLGRTPGAPPDIPT
jgi:NAD(P)-dependent dehydrogenase (short-subunit alcohol dehydrogenase family)